MDDKPITVDRAIKLLQAGWGIFPLCTPFCSAGGGAVYRFFMSNPYDPDDSRRFLLSDRTMRVVDSYRTEHGHIALLVRSPEHYEVIGKSGGKSGDLWKAKRAWILQMHGSPTESFESVKVAKAAALEYALRY
jgi:hypothetical protein